MDNGPEFIADTLRDWCKEHNIKANYCDPGSLLNRRQQNGRIELFNSRLRDELLTREVFDSPLNGGPKTVCLPHNRWTNKKGPGQ